MEDVLDNRQLGWLIRDGPNPNKHMSKPADDVCCMNIRKSADRVNHLKIINQKTEKMEVNKK